MNLILKYSPFKTHEAFLKQFDKITEETGTLIMVYNLKLMDNGEPELVLDSATSDIVLNSTGHERFVIYCLFYLYFFPNAQLPPLGALVVGDV